MTSDPDFYPDGTARPAYLDRMLDLLVAKGVAYRHRPGPPIDETLWLRDGIVATVTGTSYDVRYLR